MTAGEYIARARTAWAKETIAGNQAAAGAFKSALTVDPSSGAALSGLVEVSVELPDAGKQLRALPLDETISFALALNRDAPVLRAKGALAVVRGSPKSARESLAAAVKLDPSDARAHTWLAWAWMEDPQKAEKHAREAVKIAPASSNARLVLGAALRRLGDFEQAEPHLRARRRVEPADTRALRELALGLLEDGKQKRAQRLLATSFGKQTDDLGIAELYARVSFLGKQGARRADALLAELTPRAREAADGASLVTMRIHRLLDAGQAQQALALAEEAERRFAADRGLQEAIAHVYGAVGRSTDMRMRLADIEKAAEDAAEVARVSRVRGDLELAGGQLPQAQASYERSLATRRDRPLAHLGLVAVYLSQGDEDAAGATLAKLLAVEPGAERDRLRLDEVGRTNPLELIRATLAKAAKGKRSPLYSAARGAAAFHLGDDAAARRHLSAALKVDGNHPLANLYLAVLELDAGKARDAARRARTLEELAATEAAVRLTLARAEIAVGREDKAEKLLDDLPPHKDLTALLALTRAELARRGGEISSARYHYLTALLSDSSYRPPRVAMLQLPVEETDDGPSR
jgi:tetratricopeptide (TPR) repeat protein